jgi:hypothetical protein
MRYAEVEYWMQWYRELKGVMVFKKCWNSSWWNGRPVRMGPGIQEQLEDSHVHRYSHLTASWLKEYLDIFYSRVKPGKEDKSKGIQVNTECYSSIELSRLAV